MSWTKTMFLSCSVAFFGLTAPAIAQNAQDVRKEVDELKKDEAEARKKLEEKLNEKRAKAVAELDKLIALYERRRDEDAVDALEEQREYILERMGDAAKELKKSDSGDSAQANEVKIVRFNEKYSFSDDEKEIEGEMFFYENKKVKLRYFQGGKEKEEFWAWQHKGDHIYIQGNSLFGPVYVSEVPKSNNKSIIIRWSGTLLKHRTAKATIK